MYCMNCGTKNEDQAKYCARCGQRLVDNIVVEKKTNLAKRKSRNLFLVLISLALVTVITTVTIFDLWPWSARADKEENAARMEQIDGDKAAETDDKDKEQAASNDGVVTFENFPLDAIIEQCPDCQAAMETYIAMLKAGQDWTTPKEELEALGNQLCVQMQHFCTADAIYVEDIPYVYHGSFGLYTGDWIGAGPAGKGAYTGTVYDTNIVSYTGDWGFGLPNGEGQLYLENYYGTCDMTYTGEMKNGMRDGVGSLFEYDDQQGMIYPIPNYRVYDTAVYSNNCLTDKITGVKYDESTGEIIEYFHVITDDNGNLQRLDSWGPDELSPEVADKLYTIIFVAATGYMMGTLAESTIDSMTSTPEEIEASNQRVLAETNRLRAQDEQKKADEAERIEREMEEQRANAWAAMDQIEDEGGMYSNEWYEYYAIYNQ